MKKALALLLPLTLLISAVSCSKNDNSSEVQQTSSSAASESFVIPGNDLSDGFQDSAGADTNYTRGYVKDGVYINEYANIKMKVPETLTPTLGSALAENKAMFVDSLSDQADKARESARIWDAQFANPQENVAVNFINTKLAFPDLTEVTEADVLKSYKDYIQQAVTASGGQVEWKENEKATIGGEDYIGNIAYYGGDQTNYEALFMRKLDDTLICWLHFSSNSPDKTPEYYAGLFS